MCFLALKRLVRAHVLGQEAAFTGTGTGRTASGTGSAGPEGASSSAPANASVPAGMGSGAAPERPPFKDTIHFFEDMWRLFRSLRAALFNTGITSGDDSATGSDCRQQVSTRLLF